MYSRNFNIQRRDGNENVKKHPIGSVGKRCLTLFFVIFLAVLHNEDVKMPNFTF